MSPYIYYALAAVASILILRRLQSSSASSISVDSAVPRTADGVKQLLTEGHPIRAMKLAHEITGNDPAKAQALIDALGIKVQVKVNGHITTNFGHRPPESGATPELPPKDPEP